MKKDQYIPHEISMRNTPEVMNLIEKEGPAGYGIHLLGIDGIPACTGRFCLMIVIC